MFYIEYKGLIYPGYVEQENDINDFVVSSKTEAQGILYEENSGRYKKRIPLSEINEGFFDRFYARVMNKDCEVVQKFNYMEYLDIWGPYSWTDFFEPVARDDIRNGILRVPVNQIEYIYKDTKYYHSPDYDNKSVTPVRTKMTVEEFQEYYTSYLSKFWYNNIK